MTSSEWGRVDDIGTVYVRTATGEERVVGQYPEGTPEEALAFYADRFTALETEVHLLDQRVRSGVLSPEEATERVKTVRASLVEASAVGDLASLTARLDSLGPVLAQQRSARKAEKAQRNAEAKKAKEDLVEVAEKVAAGNDWRHGSTRLRDLLEQWKALPRIDRPSDDALWKRFSAARSAYGKRRKQHFAEQDEKRGGAQVVKERLVVEAESLATSTEWGPTSGRYRDLMRDWKAAGPAPKSVDDALWKRFRGAQDQFFGARDAANAELDQEYAANAVVKDELIAQAEALLPVKDAEAAKRAFRDIADKWDEAGKVPRDRVQELEGRIRKVEQAIRSVEDEKWKRSDPEKSARADDMVAKLEAAIAGVEADLEKARTAGDDKRAKRLEDDLASRQAFLDMARRAAADYSG
ncbi:hypothetical protein ENKNEFLB_02778 [Nocardioides aquaticus]|uniref:DUF349 domain-containing protein n=1 Tax=Nocardioides aquaticus TaxID=160826 RepID=A0ABX8EIP4_9ACTN|nr:DUF349 domain-containing protein [Nocardioides aquaticus]QVT80383.1 hypothetical protein ENKNEFLB_02778 [Nocardioides aquaticus]